MVDRIGKSPIIVNPENYEDMKKKLLEREEEGKRKALEKHGVQDVAGLKKIAEESLRAGSQRSAGLREKVKDPTVLTEPKSPDVKQLRDELSKAISEVATKHFPQKPGASGESLKGRISEGPSAGK